MNQNKKAAIELSIGTVVIIVLAMSMLILGLVLIRNIFTGATDSVNILDDKVQSAIVSLFAEEGTDVAVLLGPDRTAKIKPGSDDVTVGVGSRTPDGSEADRKRLQYKATLENPTGNNCVSPKFLGDRGARALFKTPLDQWISFDEFSGANVFASIEITVKKGTATCSQKIFIDVRDTENNNDEFAGTFFRLEILKEGLF
ncbi:hypothetical protein J4408_03040 [Candidatus Pacearchaeota archaeon]|nr:hypothetical protein [Candidatus Pacearchaeota archaeon]